MSKKELKKIDLKSIKNPDFLQELSYKEMDLLASDLRDYIIDVTSRFGGHLSSNLGAVESTISLCRSFDFSKDKIIFDVGHQTYTYKILTGRSLEGLRTINGPSGFQKMSESPYDHFECGHSSTSISVANGMAVARDLNNEDYDVIAYIGDGSLVNGLAFEGLNLASQNDHKIIIVLNDNDMSISKSEGGLARAFRRISSSSFYASSKSFARKVFPKCLIKLLTRFKNWIKRHLVKINIFDILGYKVIGPIDGHDIKRMDKAFAKAKRMKESVVVHLKTVKGRGYKYAEEDQNGDWHGVGKFNKETGERYCCCPSSWSESIANILLNKMRENEDIVTIVPATGVGSSLDNIKKEFPNRFIDVGIAEEHAATMAGALATTNKHPVISIYSTFMQRAYDEIIHDIARVNAGVTFLVDRAGLVGADGNTHQGLYDEAFLIDMPNTIVSMPSNILEAKYLLDESMKHNCPFFIRYPKESAKEGTETREYRFGKWIKENEASSKDLALISVGPITQDLKEVIIKDNIDVTLINALYQNPMDLEMINELIAYKKIIVCDVYATENGFVDHLFAKLLELGYKGQVVKKAVPNIFVDKGNIEEQRKSLGLSVENIIEEIK